MDITIEINLSQAAHELNLPLASVQGTVTLLDEGNTVPFITRYRKDQTGALDEEQIRRIQEKVGKLRGVAERKQTILRSVESQGVLTAELADLVLNATSLKRLEDLYLPYKPKKQTLAATARQRGLEPLALEVLGADPVAAELRQRAETLVNPENELQSVDDVLLGVQHIIAELYSERADVRGRLRKILRRDGKLVCSRIENPKQAELLPSDSASVRSAETGGASTSAASSAAVSTATISLPLSEPNGDTREPAVASAADTASVTGEAAASDQKTAEGPSSDELVASAGGQDAVLQQDDSATTVEAAAPVEAPRAPAADSGLARSAGEPVAISPMGDTPPVDAPAAPVRPTGESLPDEAAAERSETPDAPTTEPATSEPPTTPEPTTPEPAASESTGDARTASREMAIPLVKQSKSAGKATGKSKRRPLSAAMTKKEKKRQRLEAAFKDYYEFQESISRIPSHRVLAINRGERARILRVKLDADMEAMAAEAESLLVPEDQPHREFLKGCIRDALGRLLLPSLGRELRREMTEKAEEHAVEVFARNLRKLLLQPPVHRHRVLAVDPGYRSGCKLIALDEFGNVLGHDIIHVIGKEEWIRKGRAKLVELIRRHQLSVVAIGNGAACRETEQLVVDVMEKEIKDQDVAFVIVNEAGASVYSTSPLGREELPTYDAVLRSAISIGRRLLDPLSELVKINPANIGVGMYQHDVKAKHLRNSLDAVVESCVNYVGVDVNTASPALLRYVSGMNQLTARRLCEYRARNGPFHNREQIKQVPGLGEATFIQAAGFLKITNGDNPLDATWIHPESYELAREVLDTAGCGIEDLRTGQVAADPAAKASGFGQLAADAKSETKCDAAMPSAASLPGPDPDAAEPAAASETAVAPRPDSVAGQDALSEPIAPEQDAPPPTAGAEADPQETTVARPDETSDAPVVAAAEAVEGGENIEDAPNAEQRETAVSTDQAAVPPARVAESAASEPLAASTDVAAERLRILYEKVHQLSVEELAKEWSVSQILLRDILDSLARPGRDPREDLPAPLFRHGIVKLEDLEPGMKLSGTVLNVVDFGAFVDIGLSDSGLIHISRLADRFVRDPHELVGVGDVLTVWVVEIDKQRRRVSLTAIEPGTEKPAETRRRPDKPRSHKPTGRRPHSAKGPRESKGKGRPPRDQGHKSRPPRKPKVGPPITKEMEDGKEPLRSFSDLMQFYQKKQSDDNESKS